MRPTQVLRLADGFYTVQALGSTLRIIAPHKDLRLRTRRHCSSRFIMVWSSSAAVADHRRGPGASSCTPPKMVG